MSSDELLEESWPWKRFLWIGHLKEDSSYCYLSRLPKELIQEIAQYLDDEPQFFQHLWMSISDKSGLRGGMLIEILSRLIICLFDLRIWA